MKNKLALKFIIPAGLLTFFSIILIGVVVVLNLWTRVENEAATEKDMKISEINSVLNSETRNLISQAESAVAVLKNLTGNNGAPIISGTVNIDGKEYPNINFGVKPIGNDFTIVDKTKKIVGGTATVFSRVGDDFFVFLQM